MYNKHFLSVSNYLYTHNFKLYRFLYFIYKRVKDKYEIRLFSFLIGHGDVVIDIGANIGFCSSIFSRLVGASGMVHSFEPERENYKRLLNTVTSDNVVPNNLGIGSQDGYTTLYTSSLINVDHKTYKTDKYKTKYRIKTTSIDKYAKSLKRVDFIKLDIQGGELEALIGMKNTLKKYKNVVLFMEYWPEAQRARGYEIDRFISFFDSLKMKIYVVRGQSVVKLNRSIVSEYLKYVDYAFDDWIVTRRPLTIYR